MRSCVGRVGMRPCGTLWRACRVKCERSGRVWQTPSRGSRTCVEEGLAAQNLNGCCAFCRCVYVCSSEIFSCVACSWLLVRARAYTHACALSSSWAGTGEQRRTRQPDARRRGRGGGLAPLWGRRSRPRPPPPGSGRGKRLRPAVGREERPCGAHGPWRTRAREGCGHDRARVVPARPRAGATKGGRRERHARRAAHKPAPRQSYPPGRRRERELVWLGPLLNTQLS